MRTGGLGNYDRNFLKGRPATRNRGHGLQRDKAEKDSTNFDCPTLDDKTLNWRIPFLPCFFFSSGHLKVCTALTAAA